jgi:hypothetical protein
MMRRSATACYDQNGGEHQENVLTGSCISLPKMMSQYDRQGAGLERKKLGGQFALKDPSL